MISLNHTHDVSRRSWLHSANMKHTDFPVQNLPLGVFRTAASGEDFRVGMAIGDQVLDLAALADTSLLYGLARLAAQACAHDSLNPLMALGSSAWRALRHSVFALLLDDATEEQQVLVGGCLIPLHAVEHTLPTQIGDYTDFYTSLHHALNVGNLVRPEDPLTNNFHWLPIAYHGRASSLEVSGHTFLRPHGQSMPPGASTPVFGPSARLDYELELAVYIAKGNLPGHSISVDKAEEHVLGIGLLNDWSARDIQFWEMAPLGPFLGKNFATTLSPWVVTLEALQPFRRPWVRDPAFPQALPYLSGAFNQQWGALDIDLEVTLDTPRHRQLGVEPTLLTRTNFKHQHWSIAQMVTQHTVGGCNLRAGDVFGTGTISGPTATEAGSLVERTFGGRQPLQLNSGEERGFLLDNDTVTLRGWCEKPGYARIGFGRCSGTVLGHK